MTVMLLQRSATPQLTHGQKTANNNANEAPFLFLVDIQENGSGNSEAQHEGRIATLSSNNGALIRNSFGASGSATKAPSCSNIAAPLGSQGHTEVHGVAMRYYRLWIYACNFVLMFSALGFAFAVARTLLFSVDPRRYLVPGIPKASDPTALYAYLALAIQLGLVQLLGCIAARRLSAKLLNAYWVLLLALLFGDAVIGVAWVFRFERIRTELRPTLRLRLQMDYNKEPRFSEQWDRLQKDFSCCGVTGPRDFGSRWPQTCCAMSTNATDICQQPYANGCEEFLIRWLRKTADLLFVLGFCVIAFSKLCFLGILRYEIREMIQKIRLLREPPPPPGPFIQSYSQAMPDATNNGGILRHATLSVNPTSGNAPILCQSDECSDRRHALLANNLQDGGADSDTNSHCALILEETTPTPTNHNSCNAHEKNSGNNNYEMREFSRRLQLSNGGSATPPLTNTSQNKRT